MAEQDYMLTTVDNPFDPFKQFDSWYQFDVEKGYNTCSYLARIAITSDELSEKDYSDAINQAMNEIIAYDVLGIYKKVPKNKDDMD
ncbi:MAG: hypothetical protein J6U54_05175 [Clostridiales bacterium]|nr:hypothetical protein [Clostridiales bacterium]